jgi:hypothetical protein
LREQAFDALAHLVAFGVQGAHFFLQSFNEDGLFAELPIETVGALFGGSAGLALGFDQLHSACDSLFKGGEIAAAEGKIVGMFVFVHLSLFDTGMFRDLGFQR